MTRRDTGGTKMDGATGEEKLFIGGSEDLGWTPGADLMVRHGHPQFFEFLNELADIHERKNAGYAGHDNPDPLANFRVSEQFGIPAFLGALIRLGDKDERVKNLMRDMKNDMVGERVMDTLMDKAAYSLLVRILFEEDLARNRRFLELLKELNEKLDEEFPR